MRVAPFLLAGTMLLAACGQQSAENNQNAAANNATLDIEELPADEGPSVNASDLNVDEAAAETDSWVGKWVGVEGLALEIAKTATPARYDVKVTLMDGSGNYTGTGDGKVIRFERDGVQETIRKATGDETGLKWLAGKQNCLMIKQAEGFCRD